MSMMPMPTAPTMLACNQLFIGRDKVRKHARSQCLYAWGLFDRAKCRGDCVFNSCRNGHTHVAHSAMTMLASPPKYDFAPILHNKKAPKAPTTMLRGTPALSPCEREFAGWDMLSTKHSTAQQYRVHKLFLVAFSAQPVRQAVLINLCSHLFVLPILLGANQIFPTGNCRGILCGHI